MKKFLLLSLSVFILFSSCRFIGGKRIRGNGNLVTSDRTAGEFRGIESMGFFDVYLTTGAVSEVKIEAEENLQQYIKTEIENGVLKISQAEGVNLRPKRDVKVHITAPSFDRVRLFGSGDLIGRSKLVSNEKMDIGIHGSGEIKVDVDAPEVATSIFGSGTATVAGMTRSFKGEISGSGDIKAMELKTEDAKVEIRGSGNAEIFASMKLDVSVHGSGDVRYKGPANVSSSISGSGNVKRID